MTLVPILLFADELLIMSMAATGLQQQLDAWPVIIIIIIKTLSSS